MIDLIVFLAETGGLVVLIIGGTALQQWLARRFIAPPPPSRTAKKIGSAASRIKDLEDWHRAHPLPGSSPWPPRDGDEDRLTSVQRTEIAMIEATQPIRERQAPYFPTEMISSFRTPSPEKVRRIDLDDGTVMYTFDGHVIDMSDPDGRKSAPMKEEE